MEAVEVIEKTYEKFRFRQHLQQAINTRQFMIKNILDLASINRSRKMWICRRSVMKIFDRAFSIAKQKKEAKAVYKIQRILRGHMERTGKEDLVLRAVTCKVELKQHVSAKKIQKKIKGLIVRRRLAYIEGKVALIQSTLRMRWTRRVFSVVRKNTLILQKAYRRYMARRDQIKIRLYTYLAQELQVLENVKAMEFSQLYGNNGSRSQSQKMGLLKTMTPYSIKKIHFFTRVVDLSLLIDMSEIYEHPWSSQWIKAMAESILSDSPIMSLSAGQTHSLMVNSKGKVFTWGWNDNGQCAKPPHVTEVVLNQQSLKSAQVPLDPFQEKDSKGVMGQVRIKQSLAV
mmetsp:Transcript_14062/g.21913  ORF Transcript_14062/g.21913 Transcript_14062/m.21913 type:complete len:343 (+) Transcript_14062:1579-2607(+)